MKQLIKMIAIVLALLLAVVIVVPLIALAGLFIWLKLTEEADDEMLDLEQEIDVPADTAAI